MKPLCSMALFGALSAGVACAQTMPSQQPTPPPAVRPQPPVPPMPVNSPPRIPGFQQPGQPYRYMAPMGNQAMYVFEVIRTNKDDLKLTDAQWKTIQDARDADQKARVDRSMQTVNTRRQLQDLADADVPDVAKIEVMVREMKKAEGDDMMADLKLTTLYRKTLTAEQREKLKTLAPKFEPYMPMAVRPGMPGGQNAPGATGMPGANTLTPMTAPGAPSVIQPVPKSTPARP